VLRRNEIAVAAGGLSAAIDAIMEFGRSIWNLAFTKESGERSGIHILFPRAQFAEWQRSLLDNPAIGKPAIHTAIVSRLASCGDTAKSNWLRPADIPDMMSVRVEVFSPIKLVDLCLTELDSAPSDREYFIWRNIRRVYQLDQSPEVTHVFHMLAAAVNSQFQESWKALDNHELDSESIIHEKTTPRTSKTKRSIRYQDFIAPLIHLLQEYGVKNEDSERYCAAFIECCNIVGYISVSYGSGGLRILTESLDSEFLLSKLFGVPTEIAGFDNLFGGGGIALADSARPGVPTSINGRIILIRGRFGTGKSSLALGIAAEVARKEGLAWVMPFEQTSRDCRHYLESMSSYSTTGHSLPVQKVGELVRILERNVEQDNEDAPDEKTAGVIVILQTRQDDLDVVFDRLADRAEATNKFGLRLLVVDPINSILGWDSPDASEVRMRIMKRIERIKRAGANLIMVAEDDASLQNPVRFIENLADTVIDLSVERKHGYSQRYIEVLKSRLQRDQRGRHPFSIKAGQGVTVFPSSAAVLARIRNRRFKGFQQPTRFGWDILDHILGENAIFPGDTIVIRGGEGVFKTHIGLLFLLGLDLRGGQAKPVPGRSRRAIVLPIRDTESTVRALLNSRFIEAFRLAHPNCRPVSHIKVLEVPGGFVQPGAIFQVLEREFERAQMHGDIIDRVLIDNLAHWETSCPFIREDETFGDTLTEFLRRQQTTSLFVCSLTSSHPESSVQSSLIDDANTLIHLDRIQFRGAQRVILRVVKTRGMRHKPESFDVVLTDAGLQLGTGSKLLRIGATGEVSTIPTRLYLHQENRTQQVYNATLEDSLRPILSRDVKVNSKDRTHLLRATQLSPYSTVDELQVLQLDEFQLPELTTGTDNNPLLHEFAAKDWDFASWDDISPRLKSRVRHGDPWRFTTGELTNAKSLVDKLRRHSDPVSSFLWQQLSKSNQESLTQFQASPGSLKQAANILIALLNDSIGKQSIYKPERFKDISLRPETVKLLKRLPKEGNSMQLDRLLLEDAYPSELSSDSEQQKGRFFAVPYYDNLGLLAFDRAFVSDNNIDIRDWSSIADACVKWDENLKDGAKDSKEMLFSFIGNTDENYNCLFFEILLSLNCPPPVLEQPRTQVSEACRIKEWLKQRAILKACQTMRALCRREHLQMQSDLYSVPVGGTEMRSKAMPVQAFSKAKIWRLWFTTLSEMLQNMRAKDREGIGIQPLPGDTAVAGEWYLAVPAYSAAPDVGLEIMKLLTTREEELERLRRGVGLPTRGHYYLEEAGISSHSVVLPPEVIGGILNRGFRRSQFDCYSKITRILSFHLKRIIEIEAPIRVVREEADVALKKLIVTEIESLRQNVAFVLDKHFCAKCQKC